MYLVDAAEKVGRKKVPRENADALAPRRQLRFLLGYERLQAREVV